MKHLEIDYHYIRDKVVHRELHIRYIHTTNQIADIFTKGLSLTRFALLSAKLILREPPSACGGVMRRSSLYKISQLK